MHLERAWLSAARAGRYRPGYSFAEECRLELRESDGWKNECFAPAWFAFDGKRVASPDPARRLGSDAATILAELGYSKKDLERLVAAKAVGQTEFVPVE